MFANWKDWLGSLLFPSFCCACHRFGPYLCQYCYQKLEFYPLPISLTQLPVAQVYLDQLIAAVEYDRTIGSLLHYLKYKHAEDIGNYCADLLYYCVDFPLPDLITSVPLFLNRQRERGYNQSEIIAKRLATHLQLPYATSLKRIKRTAAQATVRNRQQRLTNVENIFEGHDLQLPILGKKILLIDDVCTTGSTLNECAKVLKKQGAAEVIGLVIAHGQ